MEGAERHDAPLRRAPLAVGSFRPAAGALLGLGLRRGDENHGTVRLPACVATHPRDPVGPVRFAVNLEGFRGHFGQI